MLSLRSNPMLFCAVRGAVERLSESLGFTEPQCRSITRAVDEALTNIVRHTYGDRQDEPITVYFRRTECHHENEFQQGLEVILCDRGPAIDPSCLRGRPLEEVRPGGLGLHFIRQAMDIVEFIRKGNTNQTRLVKYLGQATQTP